MIILFLLSLVTLGTHIPSQYFSKILYLSCMFVSIADVMQQPLLHYLPLLPYFITLLLLQHTLRFVLFLELLRVVLLYPEVCQRRRDNDVQYANSEQSYNRTLTVSATMCVYSVICIVFVPRFASFKKTV